MKLTVDKQVKVEVKTLKIYVKCADRFSADLIAADGEVVYSQEDGYVPGFMPGEHYGDYILLEIDIETGQILNWTAPDETSLRGWMYNDC